MNINKKEQSLNTICRPVKFQIIIGLVCAALNLGIHFLQNTFNPLPLYMDTVFTITAAFFGGICGILCAAASHILYKIAYNFDTITLFWSICSFTVVLIVRLYLKKRDTIELPDILLLIFIITLAISVEGAAIFTFMHAISEYTEDSQVRLIYRLLERNNFPIFISALLPRVPVNILDKGISVCLGYFCFKGIKSLT